MTLQEALGDVGCLGSEFERRLALQQVLRQLYEEEEKEKKNNDKEAAVLHKNEQSVNKKKKVQKQQSFENKYFEFVDYATVHHGNLFSVILFLPVILMAGYILFIEQSSLYK